jgi:hypothetical protein
LCGEVRLKVREFLWLQSADKQLAERCTQILHGPICMYATSLRRIKVHRKGRKLAYERVTAGNLAVASLRRLQRHVGKDGYHWTKAWAELTPVARKLIFSVSPEPLTIAIGKVPNPAVIAPLLPAALQRASSPRTWTSERDQAVIAILQVYQSLYKRKPFNPKRPGNRSNKTLSFIKAVEKAYARPLPDGFGVSRSKATLNRLIRLASDSSVPNRP